MKVIVHVKDGVVGNVLTFLLLAALSGFITWWGAFHDRIVLFIAPVACFAWLYVSYILIQNIRNPKVFTLGIDGDRLLWTLRAVESAAAKEGSIPLRWITGLEFVLPVKRFEGGVRDYSLAEVFIVDVHGNRHQLPTELVPGVYRDKIIAALRRERPDIRVVERMDNDGDGH